jgi:hypothetical protein
MTPRTIAGVAIDLTVDDLEAVYRRFRNAQRTLDREEGRPQTMSERVGSLEVDGAETRAVLERLFAILHQLEQRIARLEQGDAPQGGQR